MVCVLYAHISNAKFHAEKHDVKAHRSSFEIMIDMSTLKWIGSHLSVNTWTIRLLALNCGLNGIFLRATWYRFRSMIYHVSQVRRVSRWPPGTQRDFCNFCAACAARVPRDNATRSIDYDRSSRSVIAVAIGRTRIMATGREKEKSNTRKFTGTGRNLQDTVVVVSCATVVGNSTQKKLRRKFRPVMNPLTQAELP